MAELKILGAQRVKALTDVLNAKEKEARQHLSDSLPSYDDIKRIVDDEFGLTEKRTEFKAAFDRAKKLLEELNQVTGADYSISERSGWASRESSAYKQRVNELNTELRIQPLEALKQDFEAKRTKLWLCETLEQAKAIVGIE